MTGVRTPVRPPGHGDCRYDRPPRGRRGGANGAGGGASRVEARPAYEGPAQRPHRPAAGARLRARTIEAQL
eukprot:7054555-Prymnesium_polylepis.1